MKTITFYSYKGGVGRTLLLANVARYLSRFGQSVFAMDFDLEAPGLHYKFNLENEPGSRPVLQGVVDYVHSYAVEGRAPEPIRDFVVPIVVATDSDAAINLMPAGNILSSQYWQKLARINWHDLFYLTDAKGVPFFLELKAQIESEFRPEYLLIDSRTGITETGGVATTLLADSVICLLLHSREHLDGAREVLRSIRRTVRLRNQEPVRLIPVLARLPVLDNSDRESEIVSEVQAFLTEEATELADTLAIHNIHVLHRDPALEIRESLLIGGKSVGEESALLRDYLRLVAQIVPQEVLQRRIGPIIREALDIAWDDPERAELDLIAATESCPYSEAFRALLKFYRVRTAPKETVLRTAYRYYQLTGTTRDPLQLQAVEEGFIEELFAHGRPVPLDFIYAVWQSAPIQDNKIGVRLASLLFRDQRTNLGVNVILQVLESSSLSPTVVAEGLALLRRANLLTVARDVLNKFKRAYVGDGVFVREWIFLVTAAKDVEGARELIDLIPNGHKLEPTEHLADLFLMCGERVMAKEMLLNYLASVKDLEGGLAAVRKSRPTLVRVSQELGLEQVLKGKIRPR
jgi:cellulose biosynthesis protein BcsQ